MSESAAEGSAFTDFVIHRAASPEELDCAYRLRYQFFTRELNDERYADHAKQHYVDVWDHEGSPVVLARSLTGEPLGTLRLALRRLGNYLGDELYEWDRLATLVKLDANVLLDTVGIISRGGVIVAARRTRVMSSMLEEIERIARSEGVAVLVGAVEADNVRSKRWIESNGFQVYLVSRRPGAFQGDFYFKDLRHAEA